MKRSPMLLTAVAALVVLSMAAAPQVEVKEVQLDWTRVARADGEQLYADLCAVCHGADATGDGPATAALPVPAPGLTRLEADNGGVFPAEFVRRSIAGEETLPAHAGLEMPNWERAFEDVRPDTKPFRREALAKAKIDELTDYLETLQVE